MTGKSRQIKGSRNDLVEQEKKIGWFLWVSIPVESQKFIVRLSNEKKIYQFNGHIEKKLVALPCAFHEFSNKHQIKSGIPELFSSSVIES